MAISNSQTLISHLLSHAVIALFVIILATANIAQSQTISFTYDFYTHGEPPKDLILQGDAHFPSDSTYLRLTKTDTNGNALQTSAGRAVYAPTVPFWQPGAQVDLETTVKFIIKPNANSNNPADGIVFFIAPVGTTIPTGSAGGSFGIFGPNGNMSNVFAVEFDIFVNGEWDPSFRHVGIDLESRKSVKVTEISDSLIGEEVTLRVDYEEATQVISAVVTTNSHRYEVSYMYDLSTILPQQVQVGIAASTGEYVAIHDVVSWYFTASVVHETAKGIRQFV
ncbi:hypothetical protein C2S52_005261 [Perilla frutescens var. hirtella]|nr:hypothetical protein C2S51_010390 [Perilla frutescens var. frutescens]KAH6794784.1 hypothetical protein C2S52_005261 [Perilla frutescens var. hirtella]